MNQANPRQKKISMHSLWERLTGKAAIKDERARLEAFLNAFPGAYCGFGMDGQTTAYHPDCETLLGLNGNINGIHDIQNTLDGSDSAALESYYNRLEEHGRAFILKARTRKDQKILRISGRKGSDTEGQLHYFILWIEDVTAQEEDFKQLQEQSDGARQSVKRLTLGLESQPFPVWFHNIRGKLTWVNGAYEQMTGKTQDEIIKDQIELPMKNRSQGSVLGAMAQKALLEGQAQENKQYSIIKGKRRKLLIRSAPLLSVDHSIGTAVDITDQEESEQKYKQVLAGYNELFHHLTTAIGIYDQETKLEYYNAAYAQLWGLEEQWLDSKPRMGDVLERLREQRRLPEQSDFRAYKQEWMDMFTGLIEPLDDMLYLPDSSALRMLVIPRPHGGLMVTFEDVTSRLELESSYNTLIAVQKETLDNLAEGVVVFGGDGRLKLCNTAFTAKWSINPENIEGEPHVSKIADMMQEFFDDDAWDEMRNFIMALALNREQMSREIYRNNNTALDCAATPLPDGGALVTFTDVTDRALAEKALKEKNAALQTAEQLKVDFLANVSYQLRTPLNAMIGFNDMLNNEYFGPLNDKQKEYTDDMGESGQRLKTLIDDILDLSTIEAGYLELTLEEEPVKELLSNLHSLTIDWAMKENIRLELKCPSNIGKAMIDAGRIKQVLLNLMRNALEHTSKGGEITLGAKREKDNVLLYVSDTGGGIGQSEVERIFKPFERGNASDDLMVSNNDTRGAGLGLTLVKNITELHGGEVRVDTELGHGTTITIALPRDGQQPAKNAK
jgi:PAS domain S-box-containing protein